MYNTGISRVVALQVPYLTCFGVSVYPYFICWRYAANSSIFGAKLFVYIHWSTWSRLVQNRRKHGYFSCPNAWPLFYCWPFWRPVVGRDASSLLAPAILQVTCDYLGHPLLLFRGQYDTEYCCGMRHSSICCTRHSCGDVCGAWTSSCVGTVTYGNGGAPCVFWG